MVQETTGKIRMIRERMKAAQSRQNSYHDKRRRAYEFQVDDHVFLRVTPVTGVGRALKSRKLTPRFIGPYQISERISEEAYRISLLPSLANLHDVRDNLTIEAAPVQIEEREVKQLRGKEIALVKVLWGGPAGESWTWEREDQMRESYPFLFPSCNFRG
ncbi:uncharacterized protein LOC131607133 [Vicia villosa]|uniref:uncharacterized protein LOC131607133 n=1 Tax=Vicia villosa TaxID=3911 RepID=UPI00273CA490|nr:uncharacterized protein LOC131607133 [Vicia villosa]